ncbi:MAG: hypothetical protein FE78DRAFT_403162 [Acidomyces sp. 'richmondensis']|nr:MAG: hypothetical protein FE78DRAFT_403162 [Acidomyces sp. 'richmondensis']
MGSCSRRDIKRLKECQICKSLVDRCNGYLYLEYPVDVGFIDLSYRIRHGPVSFCDFWLFGRGISTRFITASYSLP